MPSPKLSVAQMTSTADPEQNFHCALQLAKKAVEEGSKMLCLPECFDYVTPFDQSAAQAHTLSGPLMGKYQSLATNTSLWLSLGGFHERHESLPDTHFYNTHVMLAPNCTEPVAVYRKLHLFDAVLPSGKKVSEATNTAPGDNLVVVPDTPVGTVGLSTCYDIRFPAVYEALRKAGAQVLLVPSAFFPATGKAHWHTLLRARAIENQCYVAAAAQVGFHEAARRETYGHALIVDPFGEVLVDAGADCSPCIVNAKIDLEHLETIRARMPVFHQRRNDVLGPVADIPVSEHNTKNTGTKCN